MKVLAFAASNSNKSINKTLIHYAVKQLPSNIEVETLDINDYELPIYSVDLEQAHGIPSSVDRFLAKIAEADLLLISYAEHNANYTVAYKNLFDWATRKNMEVYQNKPIIMLSTSPGEGGANNVLSMAINSAPFFGGSVLGSLSVPSYYENFDNETNELINPDLAAQLKELLHTISARK